MVKGSTAIEDLDCVGESGLDRRGAGAPARTRNA